MTDEQAFSNDFLQSRISMNNLQEVSQKIQQLCVEMEKYGLYLSQISQSVAAWRDRLGISLEGTSQTEYIKTICAVQASNQSIRVAIQSLSNATQCGQEWVLSHGSYGYSFESSSATNSYARAEMDANDANVFLREQSNLKRDLVLKFLPSRIDAIDAAYANAPRPIVSIINRYAARLNGVRPSFVKGECYYSPQGGWIVMDENMNNAEYADVLKHEMGHFIDHMMGTRSDSAAFLQAMEKECGKYDTSTASGNLNMKEMLDDLFNTGACYDRNVTDILSALFRNHPTIQTRFDKECVTGYVAYYMHSNDYWDACDENGQSYNKRSKEVFANLFAIVTDNYRISVNFVECWFPDINGEMARCLERMIE